MVRPLAGRGKSVTLSARPKVRFPLHHDTRDVNESDTCVIISDFLADVLGYDKYGEVTTEFAIRSITIADLLRTDVIKRDAIEGEKATAAEKLVRRAERKPSGNQY